MAQTPVTAPVRIALMSVPSMMAMGTSVSGSFSAITAEPRGRPYLNGFCGPLPIPLDAGHVEPSADVAGHGVDAAEDVFILGRFAPAHDAFGLCEDVALLHQGIGALAVVQHGLHVLAAEVLDLLIVQEQNAFFYCCLLLC